MKIDVVVLTIASPLKVGLYKEDGVLFEEIVCQEKSSEALPKLFKKLLDQYEIAGIYYINEPGSFMAIKVAYIFLKTLSIIKEIPLFAQDGFYFNNNQPIKAIGKLHFVKIADKIETKKFDEVIQSEFTLPQTLHKEDFSKNVAPVYHIGAV